ncbi:MAG: type II toxin-antitoxin system PemK/MazF family toxin [Bacteroidota bacterium]
MYLLKTPQCGEIWMINLSSTKGREQSGIIHALVISVDVFNSNTADLVIVFPLTTKERKIPLYVEVPTEK